MDLFAATTSDGMGLVAVTGVVMCYDPLQVDNLLKDKCTTGQITVVV